MSNTGAGGCAAGSEPCGEYVLPAYDPARRVKPPAALLYDGRTATNPLDSATGLYREIHPVDQAVALALLVRQGTLASAPNVGSRFREIRKITATTPAQATDFARQALATLVAAKSIAVLSIVVETNQSTGAVAIVVTYKNLRTGTTQPARTVING